jgi:hypothetical protein
MAPRHKYLYKKRRRNEENKGIQMSIQIWLHSFFFLSELHLPSFIWYIPSSHLDEQGCLCTYKYYSGCGITRMTFGYTTGVWPINFVDRTVLTNGQICYVFKRSR